jgi:hypothetical protein
MGRVWPRHSHRGRPLNSIVRQLVQVVLKRWGRLGAWRVFVEASVAVFVGLYGFNLALSTSGGRTSAIDSLSEQLADSPIETVLRFVAFPALETLFWQALFFEGFARLGLPRWVPLLLSALLFAVVLHWQRGASAMVGAFWFWLVLGLVYASQRVRSFWRAFALTTAVHWGPLLFLLVASLAVK